MGSFRVLYLAVSVGNITVLHSGGPWMKRLVQGLALSLLTPTTSPWILMYIEEGPRTTAIMKECTLDQRVSTWNGEPLSTNWSYWETAEPNKPGVICVRASISRRSGVGLWPRLCWHKCQSCPLWWLNLYIGFDRIFQNYGVFKNVKRNRITV